MSEMNVCTEVVEHDLCSGCGVCASICPQKTLAMQWNTYGEYIAVNQYGRCSKKCKICLQVCPFAPDVENEDAISRKLFADIPGIQHHNETGYYFQSYMGYSKIYNHRLNGASGGLTTWTLEALLRGKKVDYAVCVSSNPERDKLFKYVVCSKPEQVRACAKSCYYPVEMSEVISQILTQEGRYAVVGLPCFVKALRLAMKINGILKRRIRYVLGIVCGQQKGKYFAEYCAALKGVSPRRLVSVHFREKDESRPAHDYGMKYFFSDDQGLLQNGVVYWSEGMGKAWLNEYFKINACNYCDDIFAELADIVFMDAWLPEYKNDWRGTNLVIARSFEIQKLLEKGQANKEIVLIPVLVDSVVQSQAGGIKNKRVILSKRLTYAADHQWQVPPKRVQPSRLGILSRLHLTIETATIQQSKVIFLALKNKGDFNTHEFSKKMKKTVWGAKLAIKVVRKLLHIKQKIGI
ncbi:MAG: Coenzyme F420 hydrogenase/dehydrogenase, beta subunit C-terminal domain [Deltaproteobacteria bacterium]|nr:Coenzyme F420 hydrogenase/dehydrogenase, beta subunit C-terminal domain [Deltaproteobacteria bacterium]